MKKQVILYIGILLWSIDIFSYLDYKKILPFLAGVCTICICRRGDSNPYILRHTYLKRTCIPIPPRRLYLYEIYTFYYDRSSECCCYYNIWSIKSLMDTICSVYQSSNKHHNESYLSIHDNSIWWTHKT